MTIGVSFDGAHCLDDLGLYLTNASIGAPEVQTNYIDVPGRDGQLDLSTALTGAVRYKNRTIELTFATAKRVSGKEWHALLSDVSNLLHGQEKTIAFDGDDYYYKGRCTVTDFAVEGEKHTLTVSCNCEPYKYSASDSYVKSL
ncbi:MAG: phage tail family protein [Clostridiales bacterium]|nr:phage tail family protein [Clostridiales bacterium]